MPAALSPKVKHERVAQGRRIRYAMEERGIGNKDLQDKFSKSYPSIYLALYTHQLPNLRNKIEQFVMAKKPVATAA